MPDSLYFIALLPPPPLQEQIQSLQQEVASRFASRAALKSPPHITLIPPLKLSEAMALHLREDLETVSQQVSPFGIDLKDFAVFAPRVLYVHVEANAALNRLHAHLNDRLKQDPRFGSLLTQRHPFTPHITLGFRDLLPHNFRLAWAEFQHRSFRANFVAEALTLLQHNGHQWEAIATYPLCSVGTGFKPAPALSQPALTPTDPLKRWSEPSCPPIQNTSQGL